ncbi:MAG: T6SS effector amidase Tae4 family protein, partial [Candidatus Kapaibacterium sp.]
YVNSPVGVIASIIKHTDGSNNLSTEKLYYLQSDFLGSVERLIDDSGNPVPNAWFSYNIWGELRDPNKWGSKIDDITLDKFELLERGFTGHEHLIEFTLINMNGRVYDPVIGQFIQPDNHVALPNESQSYNRFSYVMNNPLKYTDPSGEWIQFAFMAVISAAQATTAYNWGGTSAMWNSIGMSVGSFALGAATGALAGQAFKGLGMTTTSSGQTILSKTGSIIAGATGSVTSTAILAGVTGSKFTLTSLFSSVASGGLAGGNSYDRNVIQAQLEAEAAFYERINAESANLNFASKNVMGPQTSLETRIKYDEVFSNYTPDPTSSRAVYYSLGENGKLVYDIYGWINSCVLRVDIALRESGVDTKTNAFWRKDINGKEMYKLGVSVISYIQNLKDLFNGGKEVHPGYIKIEYDPEKRDQLNQLIGKRGIIGFDLREPAGTMSEESGADGHFSLFDASKFTSIQDFNSGNGLQHGRTSPYWNVLGKGSIIYFWELP